MLSSNDFRARKESVLASTDIVALIGQTVALKKSGKDFVGLCPFHQERTPSFTVSPTKRFFHCYGCTAHGNAIDFVMKRDRLSFVDALRSLSGGGAVWRDMPRSAPPPAKEELLEPKRKDLHILVKQFRTALNPSRLEALAQDLGLTVATLHRLSIGWAGERYCPTCERPKLAWSFPMTNAAGDVRGIRLRFVGCNHKGAIKDGREGLFIPRDLEGGQLFVCEGPTDTAALLDLGFAAIGRPSARSRGGRELVKEFIRHRHAAGNPISQLVIVADNDSTGLASAKELAAVVRLLCPVVHTITPPDGVKDARAWKRHGATAADVEATLVRSPRLRIVLKTPVKKSGALEGASTK